MKLDRIKDGEMILRNIIEGMNSIQAQIGEWFMPAEHIQAKFDLLLHLMNNLNLEHSTQKIVSYAQTLLKDKDLREVTNE